MPYLFGLPFPNRASDSGNLYIDFNLNHLTFPVALLDFHVEARSNHSFANHAYASHTASRISYHVHVLVVYYVVCFFSGVCFFGLVPVTSRLWGPIRLRLFVFFMDSFFFLAGFSGKMIIPSKSLLSLLARCSLFCYAYAAIPTTCLSCLLYCWTKPLTHLVLANPCLAMLPLCSAPLIALLVPGEDWSLFHVWNLDILLGYHNISYLINASIYLVKGGRLGLMPGVLFHSCRPSFRHIGVMFPDFCVPNAVGWFMGPPWQFALNKTPPARPNIGFTICLTTTYISLGSN